MALDNTDDTLQGLPLIFHNVVGAIRGSFSSPPPLNEPSPTASEVAAIQSSLENTEQVWDSPKPSIGGRRQRGVRKRLERQESARIRRTRAVWPTTTVSSTVSTMSDDTGLRTETARDFVVGELVEKILGLVPLESDEDAELFARRLEAFAYIVGRDALSATKDDEERTILWYCVDADDATATGTVCDVFARCVTKIVAEAPDASRNPLALAKARGEGLAKVISDALYDFAEADSGPEYEPPPRSADRPPQTTASAPKRKSAPEEAAAARFSFWVCCRPPSVFGDAPQP